MHVWHRDQTTKMGRNVDTGYRASAHDPTT
jgi:hypothetical protein